MKEHPILVNDQVSRNIRARLQEISAEDCVAEGVTVPDRAWVLEGHRGNCAGIVRNYFRPFWDTLYPGSFDRNDWVWCCEFEVKA